MQMHTKILFHNKKYSKVAFFLYTAGMLCATLSPVKDIQPSFLKEYLLFKNIDKLIHALMFIPFGVLYYAVFFSKNRTILLIIALVGIIIELLQYILPTGRSFDWADWFFDILGGFFSLLLIFLLKKKEIL